MGKTQFHAACSPDNSTTVNGLLECMDWREGLGVEGGGGGEGGEWRVRGRGKRVLGWGSELQGCTHDLSAGCRSQAASGVERNQKEVSNSLMD